MYDYGLAYVGGCVTLLRMKSETYKGTPGNWCEVWMKNEFSQSALKKLKGSFGSTRSPGGMFGTATLINAHCPSIFG